ncbi:MAG: hypothetical protein ACYSWW_22480, partial [Planctomycetota bacterium]
PVRQFNQFLIRFHGEAPSAKKRPGPHNCRAIRPRHVQFTLLGCSLASNNTAGTSKAGRQNVHEHPGGSLGMPDSLKSGAGVHRPITLLPGSKPSI